MLLPNTYRQAIGNVEETDGPTEIGFLADNDDVAVMHIDVNETATHLINDFARDIDDLIWSLRPNNVQRALGR